jgi:hypothetical protein
MTGDAPDPTEPPRMAAVQPPTPTPFDLLAALVQAEQARREDYAKVAAVALEVKDGVDALRSETRKGHEALWVKLGQVEDQAVRTNGRVTVLEKAWERMQGARDANSTTFRWLAGVASGTAIGVIGTLVARAIG